MDNNIDIENLKNDIELIVENYKTLNKEEIASKKELEKLKKILVLLNNKVEEIYSLNTESFCSKVLKYLNKDFLSFFALILSFATIFILDSINGLINSNIFIDNVFIITKLTAAIYQIYFVISSLISTIKEKKRRNILLNEIDITELNQNIKNKEEQKKALEEKLVNIKDNLNNLDKEYINKLNLINEYEEKKELEKNNMYLYKDYIIINEYKAKKKKMEKEKIDTKNS